jgi:hypothetical protein
LVIAAKVVLSEEREIVGTAPELPPEEPDDGLLLPQADRTRPAVRTSDNVALFLVTAFKINHLGCM